MAIAFDAASNAAADTGNFSWTHTPVGTPKGVVVLIVQSTDDPNEVSAVTYGGVAMAFVAAGSDAAGEQGRAYAYFLGAGVPTGPQTVAVTVSAADPKRPVAITVTADSGFDTAVEDSDTFGGDTANPTLTLVTGAGVTCFCAGATHSGLPDVANIAGGADYTDVLEHDFGARVGSWIRRTSNSSGGNVTLDWVSAIDDVAAVGVAIKQVAAPATVGLPMHHIGEGMGDTGEGARLPQTLHTIEQGIALRMAA